MAPPTGSATAYVSKNSIKNGIKYLILILKGEAKDPEEMKETPAKENKESLQVEAAGAEGAASMVEVENVVQKEYLGTGQSVDEDEVRLLYLLYL